MTVRARELALAALLALALVAIQERRLGVPPPRAARAELPTWDAYVYLAMAEAPAVFTAAPWGYRVLPPAIVDALPFGNPLRGFRALTLASLAVAFTGLYAFLRRAGVSVPASALGMVALAATPQIADFVKAPYLTDPLALALEVLVLLAIAVDAPLALVALLLMAGILTKEIFLGFVPALALARVPRVGWPRALRDAALVAAPAIAMSAILRAWWTPYLDVRRAPPSLALARVAWDAWTLAAPRTLPVLLLSGLLPVAVLGAVTPRARPFLRVFGYLVPLLFAAALFAWAAAPDAEPVPYYGPNTERLLVYALPLVVALAGLALDAGLARVRPGAATPPVGVEAPGGSRWRTVVARVSAVSVVAGLAVALLSLDRYRRLPLHEIRNGPLLVEICRRTRATAERLRAGQEVDLVDGEGGSLRWFLWRGWGPRATEETGSIVMRAVAASLVVPCDRVRDLGVRLALVAPDAPALAVALNGAVLPGVTIPADGRTVDLRLPAAALFRGDNLLILSDAAHANGGAELRTFEVREAVP